jgi:hypothetical protein
MHHFSGKSAGATRTVSLVVKGLIPHGLRNGLDVTAANSRSVWTPRPRDG